MNIIHSWQEDDGFRAARSRNNAIFKSSGDYIVLIDGDTILHPNFVKDHIASAEFGYFVQGSRALLSEKQTIKALAEKIINFPFFSSHLITFPMLYFSQFYYLQQLLITDIVPR